MDKFIGNITDTTLSKNPVGTWQNAKNILLTKGFQSVSNEDGLLKKEDFDGVLLGTIISNTDEVYFSLDGDTSEIGYINKRVQNPSYEVILRDDNLGFRLDCPIEGIYSYNYKKELIVVWCHGIRDNAARPMIFNITSPLFSITGGTIDNADDLELIYLFPNLESGDFTLNYLEEGNLEGDIAYITYSYVYNDGSRTPFFPISNSFYTTYLLYNSTKNNGVNIVINNLDSRFSKIKLGVVLKGVDILKGYISYDIGYSSNSVSIDLTSIDSYTVTSPDEIIIRPNTFSKIKTITNSIDQLHIANTVQDDLIDFQKYANQLILEPTLKVSDSKDKHSFMPDEVYSMNIELQLLDGTFTDGFHIPGRVSSGTETNVLTAGQITDYNLSWIDPTTKQFRIFNTGTVGGTLGAYTSAFGYWENVETYPDHIDYDSSGVGGSDLRNTPIRHHRFPSLESLYALDPDYLPASSLGNDRFIFGVKLTNFDSIVPTSIKNKIQGYRITYVKRTFSNSLVIDNCPILRRIDFRASGFPPPTSYANVDITYPSPNPYYYQFSRMFSNALFKYKPNIVPTFIIGNYLHGGLENFNETNSIPIANRFTEVASVEYVPPNNLAYGNQYTEEGINLNLETNQTFNLSATSFTDKSKVAANITLIQLKDNLYQGINNIQLAIAGYTNDLVNEIDMYGGDISVSTYMEATIYVIVTGSPDYSNAYIILNTGYYSPLHESKLYNDYGWSLDLSSGSELELENRQYTFDILGSEGSKNINDIDVNKIYSIYNIYVNKFPFRINSTNKIPTESNIMEALRTFPVNSYYDMPNNKGEIWALRGSTRTLYIQQKFSLFITTIKDRLYTSNDNIYLGTSQLFETVPDEIVKDDKGYIGCTSQFACILFKGGYVTVDQVQGKIFLIYGGKEEISSIGKRNYFKDNWDIGFDISDDESGISERVDNPFVSVGHIVGYDDKNNRLLFTKRHFVPKDVEGLTNIGQLYYFDGNLVDYTNETYFENKSKTWSFSLDNNVWVCEHDYYPNIIFHTSNGLYSILNSFTGGSLYEHNNIATKGLFYGNQFPSYIDLIFNSNLDISKLYQSIIWVSDAINNTNNGDIYNETITHIAVYNKSQCSGLINLKDNQFLLTRVNEGQWSFNAFRDLVIDQFSPVIDENGEIIEANLNNNKLWFEKNNFISKFIVVRLYIDNVSQNTILLHSVNVQSIKSVR